MNKIIIDKGKCIGCALCVNDCPNACLFLEKGKARFGNSGCIECGHCYAICPQGAVKLTNYDCEEEPVVSMSRLDSKTLLAAMRSRRTIRQFTQQPVDKDVIRQILEAGRYSPTGGNSQKVSFTILGSRQKEAERLCINLFRGGQRAGSKVVAALRQFEISDTFFFKGAPLVIVVSGRSSVDASLASAYMEIMAESLGLGVLYSGFFIMCTRISRKLRNLLRLPKGHKAVTCMVIGYPAVKYQRIVPRKKLQARVL
jgi:nitroreductase/NAD-dependent dihydropyrimidine dehydrogenase PreA subunit